MKKILIIMLICFSNIILAAEIDDLKPILTKPDGYKLWVQKNKTKGEFTGEREDSIILEEVYPQVDKTPNKEYGDKVGDAFILGVDVRCDKNLIKIQDIIHFHKDDLEITEHDENDKSEKIYKKPIPGSPIAFAIDWYCTRHW